ncbi:hypothetical protein [Pedobacter glucosidilyticus]|uniref:hypothetical protein n=1 Tax=Pedobacter glucosidilyticus TaxID=1122941 RepID=UPI0026EB173D|nr:hypothetical protein [Pedobacter glucosidilyticus]
MSNYKYPYTVYPSRVLSFLNYDFNLPQVPVKPSLPNMPNKVNKNSYSVAIIGVLLFFVGAIISEFIILLISCFLIIISFILGAVENRSQKRLDSMYNRETENYSKSILIYNSQLKVRNELITKLKNIGYREQYKLDKIKEFFKAMNYNTAQSSVNKGVTEDLFFDLIKKVFFDNEVLTGKTISNEYFASYSYVPDILLYDKEIGAYVDIEIDEPYTLVDKKPIHFLKIENDEFLHSNSLRDDYFASLGVVIIRFSESQILESPFGCLDYISKVMYSLTNNDYYLKLLSSYIYSEVKEEEFWLVEDSIEFAKKKKREYYFFGENGFSTDLSEYFKPNFKKEQFVNLTKRDNFDILDDDFPF